MHPAEPPRPASAPRVRAPAGTCDTHIHILAAPDEYPLWDGRIEDPAAELRFDDFLHRYKAQMDALGVSRTVIVQSILYGTDNTVTMRGVEALGRDRARAIVLVRDDVSDDTLDALLAAGAVGVRLNYVHSGVLTFEGAKALGPRLAARGMHIQMLLNAHKHMDALTDAVRALPVKVVVDHIGWPDMAAGPDEPGFQRLCALVAEGAVTVKLSGLYRLSRAPYQTTDAFVAALAAASPQHCVWGSDYPFIMLAGAEPPDAGTLFDAFHRAIPDERTRQTILVDTPAALYGFNE
ncbi:MAG: amidohydrolase family protein [Pseudomonadota bacterium]